MASECVLTVNIYLNVSISNYIDGDIFVYIWTRIQKLAPHKAEPPLGSTN